MSTSIGTLAGYLILDDKLSPALLKAQKQFSAAQSKFNEIGKQLSKALTVPLLAAGGATVALAKDFQSSMRKVETLVGVNRKQVDAWSTDVLKMAGTVGKSPKELADALFVVTSAGERGANALRILNEAAKASAIGLGDTSVIARATTGVMQAYKQSNLDAETATRIMIATVQEGNLAAEDLAGSIGSVAGMAASAGVSFQEVGAYIGTYTRVGISAEQATNSLRSVMTLLIKPTQTTRQTFASLRDPVTGAAYSLDQFRKEVAEKGLTQSMLKLNEMIGDNVNVLGDVIPNYRAMAGFLGTAKSQGEAFAGIIKIINDAASDADFTNKRFARSTETFGHALEELKSRAQATGIAIGAELIPVFTSFIHALSPVLGAIEHLALGFAKLPEPIKLTVIALTSIAIAAGPTLWGLSKVMGGLVALRGATIAFANSVPVLTARLWAMDVAQKGVIATLGASSVAASAAGAALLALKWVVLPLAVAVTSFKVALSALDWKIFTTGTRSAAEVIEYASLRVQRLFGLIDKNATNNDLWNSVAANTARRQGDAAKATKEHAEAVQQLANQLQGKEVAKKVTELTDAVGKLSAEQLKQPDIAKRLRAELQMLQQAGGKLTPKLQEVAKALGVGGGTLASLSEQLKTAKQQMSQFSASTKAQIEAGVLLGKSNNDIAEATGESMAAVELYVDGFQRMRQQALQAISPLKEVRDKVAELTTVWMAYAKLGDAGQFMRKEWIEENAEAISKAERNAIALGIALPKAFQDAARAAQQFQLGEVLKEMHKATAELAFEWGQKQIEDAKKVAEAKNQLIAANAVALVEAQRNVARDLEMMSMSSLERELAQLAWAADDKKRLIDKTAENWEAAYKAIDLTTGNAMANVVRKYDDAMQEMKQSTTSWGKTLTSLLGELPSFIQQAFTGGGGLAGGLKAITSKVGSTLVGGLFSDITGFGNKIATGAMNLFGSGFATKVGGMLPTLLPGIGSLVGSLVGPAVSWIGSLFGPSKQKKENLAADSEIKSMQGELLKTYGSLDQIRAMGNAVGVSLADAWGHKTVKGLEQFKKTVEEFQKKQEELQAALDKYGMTWLDLGKEMRDIKWNEMTDALLNEYKILTQAGADPTKVIKNMGGALSQLVVDAANAGTKIPVAFEPMLRQLIQMGGLTDAAAQALLGLPQAALPSLSEITDAAARYGLTLDDLGPKVKQLEMNELASQLSTDFALFSSLGSDMGVVFDKMGGQVQTLVDNALKYGLELPASMKPVIEAMMKAGRLTDDTGAALEDLGKLTFAKELSDMFETLLEKLDAFFDRLSGGVTVPVDVNYREHDNRERGVNERAMEPELQFAGGSHGVWDFGPGTLAELHGREAVLTESQLAALGSGETVITLNGEPILRYVTRKMGRQMLVNRITG